MKRISKYIILFLALFCLLSPGKIAYADDVNSIDQFDQLTGDGKYLGKDYRDRYALDIEETNFFDTFPKLWNDMANGLFMIIKTIAYVAVSAFYLVMELDLSEMFSGQINGIQEALNNSIFEPLFLLAFTATAGMIILFLFRRNMVGILGELGKVLLVLVLSMLIVKESGSVLSACTGITKSASVQALIEMNNAGARQEDVSVSNFAANAAGLVWANLIHEPWKTLEFGTSKPTNEDIDSILGKDKGSDKRKESIKNYMSKGEEEAAALNKNKGMERFAYLFVYFFPFIAKIGIFLFTALLQLIFQAVAIFFVLMAPVILLLTMVPGYGMDTLTSWLKKILESQLSLFVITFILGLMIKLDNLFGDFGRQHGWFMGLIFQTATVVGLFMYRDKLLKGITSLQKGISNKSYTQNRLKRAGTVDLYKGKEIAKRAATGAREKIERIRPRSTDIFNKKQAKQEEQKRAKRPTTTTGPIQQKGILYNSLKKPLSMDQGVEERPKANNKVVPIRYPKEKKKEPERPVTVQSKGSVNIKKPTEQKRPVTTQSKTAMEHSVGQQERERPVTNNKIVPIKSHEEEKKISRPRPSTRDSVKKVKAKELEQVPSKTIHTKNGSEESVLRQRLQKNKEIPKVETKREVVRPVTVPKEVIHNKEILANDKTENVQKAQKPIQIKKVGKTTNERKKQVIRANTDIKRPVLKARTIPIKKSKLRKKIG